MFYEFIEKQDEIIVIIVMISFQILTENLNEKSSKKRKTDKIEIINEIAYSSHDDSSMMEDDTDKDPDWKKTPLYNRIQKLQVILCYGNCLNLNNKYYIKYLTLLFLHKVFFKQTSVIKYNCVKLLEFFS